MNGAEIGQPSKLVPDRDIDHAEMCKERQAGQSGGLLARAETRRTKERSGVLALQRPVRPQPPARVKQALDLRGRRAEPGRHTEQEAVRLGHRLGGDRRHVRRFRVPVHFSHNLRREGLGDLKEPRVHARPGQAFHLVPGELLDVSVRWIINHIDERDLWRHDEKTRVYICSQRFF